MDDLKKEKFRLEGDLDAVYYETQGTRKRRRHVMGMICIWNNHNYKVQV